MSMKRGCWLLLLLLLTYAASCAAAEVHLSGDLEAELIRAFEAETGIGVVMHEDLQGLYTDEVVELLLARSPDVDVFLFQTDAVHVASVTEKDFLHPLESAFIEAEVPKMMASVQPLFTHQGRIVCFPYRMHAEYAWVVNTALLAEAGLAYEDLPKDLLGLLGWLADWESLFEDTPPVDPLYCRIGAPDMLEVNPFLFVATLMYRNEMLRGEEALAFDTPLFRELTAQAVRTAEALAGYLSAEDSARALLTCLREPTFFDQGHQRPLTLALSAGHQPLQPVSFSCMAINPFSQNLEDAQRFCDFLAQARYSGRLRITLSGEENTPIPNPQFEEQQQDHQAILDQYDAAYEGADPAQRETLDLLKEAAQRFFENLDDHRFWLGPAPIARYKETVAPALFAPDASPYGNDRLTAAYEELALRLSQKQLDIDGWIGELDGKTRMMMRESMVAARPEAFF